MTLSKVLATFITFGSSGSSDYLNDFAETKRYWNIRLLTKKRARRRSRMARKKRRGWA